jgi:hypothetical protein
MLFRNTQLALLAISCLSRRICSAETNEVFAAAEFYRLPYYQDHDENGLQHWETVLVDKECRTTEFEGGLRSIQPRRGVVCDIFS